ncbi:VOC family protein [Synechococcus sp. CS-1331]|uniref:VOC family protein n=1 Tax=Synechococcus sp. CS-1331 TaxID=2847973 RepID=UPI0019BF4FCD|nr:VOC family protein [Synechococcus sp. CS-1331]MCT0227832.1 VOC family protein [Synechococcus sp. CS-1331]NQW40175.1 VOC family protein [Cyanobacteria bacterium bin.275]
MPPTSPHISSIGFTTANAEATAIFFEQTLGFSRGESLLVDAGPYAQLLGLAGSRLKLVRLRLGEETLELTELLSLGEGLRPGRPIPADSRSCDLWFQHMCIVVSDLEAASAKARQAIAHGSLVGVSTAPQTLPEWNTAAAGIQAFKFRDPEGHNLELLQFPAGKGETRWHRTAPASAPFLGIDHSAISVADTPRSCRFYDGLLGLKLGGDGVNSGPTQDGLDGLQDTRVRITGHRCPTGAGVECLNYQPPNSGRPRPLDQGAQDLAHWQIRLRVADLDRIAATAQACGGQVLHGGVIELGAQASLVGAERALQLSDPDGHQLQLLQG